MSGVLFLVLGGLFLLFNLWLLRSAMKAMQEDFDLQEKMRKQYGDPDEPN